MTNNFFAIVAGIVVTILLGGCVAVGDDNYSNSEGQYGNRPTGIDVASLQHSRWQLDRLPSVGHPEIYRRFQLTIDGSRVTAVAFNRVIGDADINSRQFRLKRVVAISKKFVVDRNKASLESAYFSRLLDNRFWRVEGQSLILSGQQGELYFKRVY